MALYEPALRHVRLVGTWSGLLTARSLVRAHRSRMIETMDFPTKVAVPLPCY